MILILPFSVIIECFLCCLIVVLSSPVYAGQFDTSYFASINQAQAKLLGFHKLSSTRVFPLIPTGEPYTILGRIVPLVVEPFDRKSFRANTHVCEKVWEADSPSFADFYPAPSIMFKLHARLPVASRIHMLPSAVCCPQFRPSAQTMVLSASTKREAPTTGRFSPPKIIKPEFFNYTAVTFCVDPSMSSRVHPSDHEATISFS